MLEFGLKFDAVRAVRLILPQMGICYDDCWKKYTSTLIIQRYSSTESTWFHLEQSPALGAY